MKSEELIKRLEALKELGGHPRFYDLILRICELHARKNHDYAGKEHPLSNLKRSEEFGVEAWKGTLVRMSDKWDRITHLALDNNPMVKGESILDTLMDMAVYSLLAVILFEELNDSRNTQT